MYIDPEFGKSFVIECLIRDDADPLSTALREVDRNERDRLLSYMYVYCKKFQKSLLMLSRTWLDSGLVVQRSGAGFAETDKQE